jgi:hypothetical protein
MSTWRSENAEWIRLSLLRLRLMLHRRMLWLRGLDGADGRRPADWLLASEDPELERRFFSEDAGVREIDVALAGIQDELDALAVRMRQGEGPPVLIALAEQLSLSSFEMDVLLLAAAPALDAAFARAFAELHDDARRDHGTLHLSLSLFTEGTDGRTLAADALMPDRTLRSLRLIDVADDERVPISSRALCVDDRMVDYLRGANRIDARLVPLIRAVPPALASGVVERRAVELAARIAAEPAHWATVNLVSPEGGSARDLARRTCEELGLRLRAVDLPLLASRVPEERAVLVALLGREAILGSVAVLVDATDADRGTQTRQAVEELVESLAATLFVVSREGWPSGPQIHVMSVPRPSRAEQRTMWWSALGATSHTVNGEVDAIVQQFDFGPTAIAEVVARAATRSSSAISGRQLWTACREQTSSALDELALRITPSYGWEDIVVTDDARAQLGELAGQVSQRDRVYETWGFGSQMTRGRGITALFAGPSGTGKTMAAEILAGHLDLDIYRIDLAGVVSKYIGETEKNLRRVFDAAERTGVILFFDEADALFGTRTEVRDSHDRYANVEINYLLQRMEDYAGLAILATNRRAALDGAFLRRLRFVIDFPFPGPDDRRRIWERVFPAQAALDGIEYSFLSRLELTGGNIRSIAVNAAFLAAGERSAIGMLHLVRAAAREYTKLSKPVSVAEFGPYYSVVRP